MAVWVSTSREKLLVASTLGLLLLNLVQLGGRLNSLPGSSQAKSSLQTQARIPFGVLYVYWCDKPTLKSCPGLKETVESATSVKRHNPNIHITFVTNAAIAKDFEVFDEVKPITAAKKVHRAKYYEMALTPYERTLFLDSDTRVLVDVSSFATILDTYDIAMARRIQDRRYDWQFGLLDSYNSGVVLYKMNEAVATLFERWAYYYLHGKASKHDQRSLWHALRDPLVRVKIATLPPNYNLTFRPTSYLFSGKVFIVHARVEEARNLAESVLNRHHHLHRILDMEGNAIFTMEMNGATNITL